MSRILSLVLALHALFLSYAAAQSTLVAPTAAASSVAPGTGTNGYTYVGCYNETTGYANAGGVRALAGGPMMESNTLTTASCLAFCTNSSMQYCGFEYGRECWSSPYLNTFSTKLDESNCSDACVGNASETCGGSLTITLYNLTGSSKSSSSSSSGASAGRFDVGGAVAAGSVGIMAFAMVLAL